MTISQLPSFAVGPGALPSDYAAQMALIHARYDPVWGSAVTGVLERVGVFEVFSTTWFGLLLLLLVISIVVCTLDRLPRLWRDVSSVRVVQPDDYFDLRLPGRAGIASASAEGVRAVLRRHRFRLREEGAEPADSGAPRYLYGDRHQYGKLATLITHLGLILFIAAGGLSAHGIPELGIVPVELPVVLAAGQSQTIQPIGTPDLLVVKSLGFSEPLDAQGQPLDYATNLVVYRNGVQVAHQVVRVNAPLTYDGYTFHQNFTGPAADVTILDSTGAPLWTGPIPLTDSPVLGLPTRDFVVPGRNVDLELQLDRLPDGTPALLVHGRTPAGLATDGTQRWTSVFDWGLAPGASRSDASDGFTFAFSGVSAYTGLIASRDPGEGLIWFAFGCLIAGLLITFYLPRRRVWVRLDPDGSMRICGRSDRYVDFEREYGALLDDLVAASPAARAAPGATAGAGAAG